MNVLLIGSTGQLGADLLRAHQAGDYGWDISTLDRAQLDLAQWDRIATTLAPLQFDLLINASAYNKVDDAETTPHDAVAINAYAVREFATACAHKGARFLHVSTDYVFSGISTVPYVETDACAPLGMYGLSKLQGELLAQAYCQDTVIFRTASLFGVGGSDRQKRNFVETIVAQCRTEGHARVVDDMMMSPTCSRDLADMMCRFVQVNGPAGIYHAVNSGAASWHALACAAVTYYGIDATITPITSASLSRKAQRPLFSVLQNQKLAAMVGPIPSWHDALARYCAQRKKDLA